jgi:hypothetical protein
MADLFNDQLLNKFVKNFYGYGNDSGQCWFITMEKGVEVHF